jgi:excisionase family DNA binding protein
MVNRHIFFGSNMQVTKTFCTTREAAGLLGVSLSTAQNWAESGLLNSWKTEGGHRRISRDSVMKLLADPLVAPVAKIDRHLPASELRRLRVLVVEDDAALRRIYEIRLSLWAIAPVVETAADGFEGLVRIGVQRPDLLISDLLMPHLDGFQMIRSLSGMSDCAAMKIVVVTGLSSHEVEVAGGLPPEVSVFSKPVPFTQIEAIAQVLAEEKVRAAKKRIAA